MTLDVGEVHESRELRDLGDVLERIASVCVHELRTTVCSFFGFGHGR